MGGPRFGVAVGIGGGAGVAAWFPLGPGEVYRPAYHVSEVYVRNVNIVHVNNVMVINNGNVRYMNQNVAGAVTVVPHEAFAGRRRPVAMSRDGRASGNDGAGAGSRNRRRRSYSRGRAGPCRPDDGTCSAGPV